MWGTFLFKTMSRVRSQMCARNLSLFVIILYSVGAVGQTVSPDLFSGLKWRLIGPFRGGRVVAVAGVQGNPSTFFFGSVDGGVWKTTDAGMVWTPIFDGQPVGSIGALAVAPSEPNVIYAGTGEADIRSDLASGNGVYKSTDGGTTWQNVGLPDTRQISRIVIDPQNSALVYVAALGHAYAPNEERGVFKSIDGGAHWTKVLDQGADTGVADLAIAIQQPRILFATTWHTRRPPWSTYAPIDGPGNSAFRSQDQGRTWTRLTGNGLPDGDWGRSAVGVSADGTRVYLLIDCKTKPGLYRSDDGGTAWTLQNTDKRLTSRAWYFGNITVDPRNPDIFYVPNVALYRSEDGGKTISIVRGAPGGDDYHQIWVDPQDSSRMVLGTDQGTSISLNYGKTWSSWYNQPTAQLYHVATDDRFPYRVYGAQQDSGGVAVISRTDHGQIGARDWFPAGPSESGYVVPDPADPDVLYLSEVYGDVSRFDLRTSFSQDITPWPSRNFGTDIAARRYRAPWTPVLALSPADKKSLYLGTQYVMKTSDGGLHWAQISPDLTGSKPSDGDKKATDRPTVENAKQLGYGVVYTIAPSSLKPELIWAGSDTGMIHLTRDGGKNWTDVTPKGLSDWSKITLIEASHFDPAEAYAAVDRHRLDDQRPYLYRTRDYGATWQQITDGFGETSFLNAVREDPQSKGLLVAGTEFGIYLSFDDGDHWQSLQLNLPVTSVRDMAFHEDDLVIATHGRSFWVLDDSALLRQLKEGWKRDEARLFSLSTAVRVDNDAFQGSPVPPDEPTASNPPKGAIIDYYLNQSAGRLSLEIFNSNHELVRAFSSSDARVQKRAAVPIADRWLVSPAVLDTTKGAHRFIWDLAWAIPLKKASDSAEAEYGPRAPRVPPGNYEVRLTVDGKTLSQPLHLVMDPRSPATAQELDHQFRLGKQVYLEMISARQVLAEMNGLQKELAQVSLQLDAQNQGLKREVTGIQAQITTILAGDETNHVDGLQNASSGLSCALGVVESSDRTVPSQAVSLYEESSQAAKIRSAEWLVLKTGAVQKLDGGLRRANFPGLNLSPPGDSQ